MQQYLVGHPGINPFSILNRYGEMHFDLLREVRKALHAAVNQNERDTAVRAMPLPVINPDGTTESFDQYLADFGIGSVGVGTELSAIGSYTFEVDKFSGVAILN